MKAPGDPEDEVEVICLGWVWDTGSLRRPGKFEPV